MGSSARRDGWVALAVLAALLPFWRLVVLGEVPLAHDVGLSDLLHSHVAYDAALGEALSRGRLDLWLDGPHLGSNLAAQIEAAPFYPPRWAAFGLFAPWTAFGLLLGFHVTLAATGAFVLARRLGASPAAAALAGAAFGGAGFFAAHVKHPNMVASAAWLPWALAAVTASRPWPWWPIGVVATAGTWLGGHPQIAYYVSAVAGVAALWTHRRSLRGSLGSVAALGAGALISAVTVLPTALYARQTLRGDLDWAFASRFTMPPIELLGLVWPPLRGDPYSGTWSPPAGEVLAWEDYAHVGVATLVFAGLALLPGPRRRTALGLAALTLFALLFALGPHTPLFGWLWSVVPGLRSFRFPSRALLFVDLLLALLAALGLDALLRERPARAAAVAAGVVGFTALQLTVAHAPWLVSDAAAPWTAPSPWIEAARADTPEPRVYQIDPTRPWTDVYYGHEGWRDGLEPYRALAGLPIASRARIWGVTGPGGYTALLHGRTAWFWAWANRDRIDGAPALPAVDDTGALDATALRRLRKASVSHVVLPEGEPWSGDVLFERGGHRLARLPPPRPPAFVTGRWRVAGSQAEARSLAEADDDVVVEGAPPSPDGDGPAAVRAERPKPGVVRVDVTGHEGLLVLAEAWDEGWTATVDGAPAPVLAADGYLRAVLLPRGARVVELRYWPPGLGAGLGLAAVGLVLGSLLAGVAKRAGRAA